MFNQIKSVKDNRARLTAARTKLAKVSARSRNETPAYLAANRAVIKAEKSVPWLLR